MTSVESSVSGAFYHRPSPEDPPFKAMGDVIGLVEVMIDVESEDAGTFDGFAVQNKAPVPAGDVLVTLK